MRFPCLLIDIRTSSTNSKIRFFVPGTDGGMRHTYIGDNIDSQMCHIRDYAFLRWWDLCMLDQLREVLLRDTILAEDVKQNDSDFVVVGDGCIQKDGHDVPHWVLDLLTLGIGAHGQILFDLTRKK